MCHHCGGRGAVICPTEGECPMCEGSGEMVAHVACSCGRKVPMERVSEVEDSWRLPSCEECCPTCAPKVDIEILGHTGMIDIDGERIEQTVPVGANRYNPTIPDAERPCDSCGDPIGYVPFWHAHYHVGCLPPKDWREQMQVAWNRADTQGIRAREAEERVKELEAANRRLASQAAEAVCQVEAHFAEAGRICGDWEATAMWAIRKWLAT